MDKHIDDDWRVQKLTAHGFWISKYVLHKSSHDDIIMAAQPFSCTNL